MQIKIFTIPISDNGTAVEEMNRFLRANKVLEIEKQLVNNQNSASWCFCVSYISSSKTAGHTKKEKIDYINVLEAPIFKIFSLLRECRKQIAADQGIPAYAVFTDEELSNISRLSEITTEKLLTIEGIGLKKTERFGKLITELYNKFYKNEKDR